MIWLITIDLLGIISMKFRQGTDTISGMLWNDTVLQPSFIDNCNQDFYDIIVQGLLCEACNFPSNLFDF